MYQTMTEFDTSAGSWQKNSTLENTDCDGRFGASLALTGNGGLLVGCPFDDDAAGDDYYQQLNGDKNYTLQQKITAPDRQALDKFGGNNHHLAVSPNGDLVAIGTFDRASGLNEKVYILGRFDNVWKRVDQVDAPDDSFYFGHDVAINSDSLIVASRKNTYFYRLTCVEEGLEGEEEDVHEAKRAAYEMVVALALEVANDTTDSSFGTDHDEGQTALDASTNDSYLEDEELDEEVEEAKKEADEMNIDLALKEANEPKDSIADRAHDEIIFDRSLLRRPAVQVVKTPAYRRNQPD